MQTAQKLKFRFAPSPNGALHLGHAYSALVTDTFAKKLGGSFNLRIEDIDQARSQKSFIEAIYQDLKWLGLKWPTPVRQQSNHFDDYQKAINQLSEMGLLYPCFATRKEIEKAYEGQRIKPRDPDCALLYPGLYKNISQSERSEYLATKPFALRLDMTKAIELVSHKTNNMSYRAIDLNGEISTHPIKPERWGDVIIARKDIPTSYHLSVVVDDHIEGITHITRGQDLLASTDVQRLLQILLDLHEPLYHHHGLVALAKGQKLSKSKQHPSLNDLRLRGVTPEQIRELAQKGPEQLGALL